MNILNSVDTAATINKIIHNAQGTTTTTEGATAAGKIIKENLPDIISAGFDMPHPTSVFEGVPPFSFISNGGSLINWSIYGNTVEGASVGEQTKNLFDYKTFFSEYLDGNGNISCNASQIRTWINFTPADIGKTLTLSFYAASVSASYIRIQAQINGEYMTGNNVNAGASGFSTITVTPTSIDDAWRITYGDDSIVVINQVQVEVGSTRSEYEPFGYKIPVICGGVTTNIYIDEPLTSGETISYNETGVIIPTTMFLNTLSVDTTVQPEKVFIEYVK